MFYPLGLCWYNGDQRSKEFRFDVHVHTTVDVENGVTKQISTMCSFQMHICLHYGTMKMSFDKFCTFAVVVDYTLVLWSKFGHVGIDFGRDQVLPVVRLVDDQRDFAGHGDGW